MVLKSGSIGLKSGNMGLNLEYIGVNLGRTERSFIKLVNEQRMNDRS
jgi:hypothetical protein